MSRPLVITDCDEVLLHFARHFRDWTAEEHGIDFRMQHAFSQALLDTRTGEPVPTERVWELLQLFFESEMDRQTAIEGAVRAIAELQRGADVVVLTNIADRFNASRRAQLLGHGIDVPVFTNQGPKGQALRRIVDSFQPSCALFIDDIAHHHASAAGLLPDITRLHLCGEPGLAPHVPCALQAGHAHARIDNWAEALPWIGAALQGNTP